VRLIALTLGMALAVSIVPAPAVGSVASVRAHQAATPLAEAPPGQATGEEYEVFIAPPSSTLGLFDDLDMEYVTNAGASGNLGYLPQSLEGPILRTRLLAPTACNASTPTAVCGLTITSTPVVAVSVDGGAPIPTVAAVGAPYGFRSVLFEVPGVSLSEVAQPYTARGGPVEPRLRIGLRPLNSSGATLRSTPALNGPAPQPVLETRQWTAPAPAARGVCQLTAGRFPGLTATSGNVVSVLRPVVGEIGQPFITCANAAYTYRPSSTDESSLEAFMVLDAKHPGRVPAPLPGMTPVPGHPGVEQSRVESSQARSEVVARRVRGAWLLVESGRDLTQRLSLLADLKGAVHLNAPAAKRRSKHS
jgi:hypothetical protein